MAPDTTIGPGPLPGQKKKDRLTFLACRNVDGTEMLPTPVIGKSKKPKCFRWKRSIRSWIQFLLQQQERMDESSHFL